MTTSDRVERVGALEWLVTGRATRVWAREVRERLLPIVALAGVFAWTASVQSNALSYEGLNLLLASAVPLVLATISQGLIISLGDIDLGLGPAVGLTNVVAATYLVRHPALGVLCLVGVIAIYAAAGLVVSAFRAPSIIVTLGLSFIWAGAALLILPTPGGSEPGWLTSFFASGPPLLPLPVWLVVGAGLLVYLILFRTRMGMSIRAAGSNSGALWRTRWQVPTVRMTTYAIAGLFAVLAGLALTGVTASGDPTGSSDFTLFSVAGAILGGSSFRGGRASAIGMVAGALVISLIGSLLGLLNVSPNLQLGVQGLVMIAVISGRRFWSRNE